MAVSKQDQVIELVKAGASTREQIKEAVGCTTGSLASYLSTMSNIAKYTQSAMCPVTAPETGIMSVTTWEEAEEAKAAKAASSPSAVSKKTPAERLEAAEKRIIRCTNALDSAKKRAEDNEGNREMELRASLAEINAELADIELARCEDLVASVDAEAGTPVADENDLL